MKGYSVLATIVIVLIFTHYVRLMDGLESPDTRQLSSLEQGGDPSAVFQPSAAGSEDYFCDTNTYRYGVSIDGYRFVQQWESPLFAVNTGQGVMLLEKSAQGGYFSMREQHEKDLGILQVLARCERSVAKPLSTELHFVMLQNTAKATR